MGLTDTHGFGTLSECSWASIGKSISETQQSCLTGIQVGSHGSDHIGLHLGALSQISIHTKVLVVFESVESTRLNTTATLASGLIVQTQDLLSRLESSVGFHHFGNTHAQVISNFFNRRLVSIIESGQLFSSLANLIELGSFSQWNSDLFLNVRVAQSTLDPNGGVGGKAKTPSRIKEFGSTDQTQTSFLNEFVIGEPSLLSEGFVLRLDDRMDQTNVGRDQQLLGTTVVGNFHSQGCDGTKSSCFAPLSLGGLATLFFLKRSTDLVQFDTLLNHFS
mmetsp:Transcript_31879/g.77272  ORF Transcript_31879/g.77272 Transcript_31879/m.77272 type:complete len:277 (-) Transcript_31879:698-1528(-)